MSRVMRNKTLIRHLVKTGIIKNQKDLGEKMGYNNESSFSQVINEKVDEPKDFIPRLKNVYADFNEDWLLTGEGEMLKVPATMTIYNPSSEERQEVGEGVDLSMYPAKVVEEIKAEVVEEIREEVRAEIAKAESVPLVSSKIANDTNVEDLQEFLKKKGDELEQIKPGDLVGNADTAERIRKTSMMPTFMPGDVVFVQFLDDKTNITDGHTYYFKMATKPTMIRKVKIEGDNLRLIAENPNFGDIITTFDEIVNVATIEGMFRSSFSNQYAEVETVRRKKDEQIDNLIEQNGQALQIIKDLIKK